MKLGVGVENQGVHGGGGENHNGTGQIQKSAVVVLKLLFETENKNASGFVDKKYSRDNPFEESHSNNKDDDGQQAV